MKRLALILTFLSALLVAPTYKRGSFTNRHVAGHVLLLSPDVADEVVFRLSPWNGTLTEIVCEAYGGTSVTIDVCDGEDTGDDTCTTSIPGSSMTCSTSGVSDTTLTNADFSAQDKVTIVISAESGSVTELEVQFVAARN